ncbi:uncharacterized protein LOC134530988 [Bacillus rossius redtenbacheri]|uniref:uncharacterized protein LOC134530988 n=1 Tax=Bacillus rossius redtenbacheri TaxID=93214 RepID=UPI002FDCDA4A
MGSSSVLSSLQTISVLGPATAAERKGCHTPRRGQDCPSSTRTQILTGMHTRTLIPDWRSHFSDTLTAMQVQDFQLSSYPSWFPKPTVYYRVGLRGGSQAAEFSPQYEGSKTPLEPSSSYNIPHQDFGPAVSQHSVKRLHHFAISLFSSSAVHYA